MLYFFTGMQWNLFWKHQKNFPNYDRIKNNWNFKEVLLNSTPTLKNYIWKWFKLNFKIKIESQVNTDPKLSLRHGASVQTFSSQQKKNQDKFLFSSEAPFMKTVKSYLFHNFQCLFLIILLFLAIFFFGVSKSIIYIFIFKILFPFVLH